MMMYRGLRLIIGSAAGVAILGTSTGYSDSSVRGSVPACFVVGSFMTICMMLYGTVPIHLLYLPRPWRQAEIALLLVDLDMSREGVGLQLLVQAARFLMVLAQRYPGTRSSLSWS
jgi:hypothetical protein